MKDVVEAIRALLASTDERPFLIVNAGPSGNAPFVQLAGSASEPKLLLDMPCKTLSIGQIGRARTFFKALGVEIERSPLYEDDTSDTVADVHEGFTMRLDRDPVAAADLVQRIFRDVYLIDPYRTKFVLQTHND